jgi:beta-phosphoglucomutase-like phosphatase (HAD superfamily)
MIKSIIFDMDGVLIDARDWHYEALNRALELFGLQISRFDHLTMFNGLPTRRKLEILTLERGLPQELHFFINELKQKYTMELICTKCCPLFAHEYALSKLKANGYFVAVCSNSIRQTVDAMMERANLAQYLDFVVSNSEVVQGKPSPEMYQKAMAFFNVDPAECLIVEDNENGIRAAKAAGGNLLVVRDVTEVNLANIMARVAEVEPR